MDNLLIQVSLISAFLLCTNAQSLYNRGDTPSYSDTPKFSIINIERSAEDDPLAEREILIFKVPRSYQAPHSSPRLVSLENVLGPAASAQSPAYIAPTATPPSWNYQKSDQPYYVAVEDVVRPTPPAHHNRHFSLFDVNLPAPPTVYINSYPNGAAGAEAPPLDSNLAPVIDVRSSKTNQKVHSVNTENTNRNTQIKVRPDGGVPSTQRSDPNRASRSTGDEDPVIVFPRPSDNEDKSDDDSVEVLAPLDRLRRNIVSLENVVGPGQIGYPVYRYPQQPIVVNQPHRYPHQPVVQYPQSSVLVQQYPQQYAGRQPYVVSEICPFGNCYRHG